MPTERKNHLEFNACYCKKSDLQAARPRVRLDATIWAGPAAAHLAETPQPASFFYTHSITRQDITYNSFNKTSAIIEETNEVLISYGPDQERTKMEVKVNGQTTSTKYYLNEFEKEVLPNGNTREVNYVNAPYGLCAMFVNDNGSKNLYYVYTDHLGSINTLADDNGNTIKQNFDPWGRQRNPNTWDFSNVPATPAWLTRGYTGHEHLSQFSLINMNGRMPARRDEDCAVAGGYDPVIGRMLSPDNEVGDPASTQGYNRYTYAFNNPLKFIDPSGNSALPGVYYMGANASLSPGSTAFSSFNPKNRDQAMLAELKQAGSDRRENYNADMSELMGKAYEQQVVRTGGPKELDHPTGTEIRSVLNEDILNQMGDMAHSHISSASTFTGTPGANQQEPSALKTYGEGFKGGLKATGRFISDQFSLKGMARSATFLYPPVMGYETAQQIFGVKKFVSDIPGFGKKDYIYGAGYVTEKVTEALILRKISYEFRPGGTFGPPGNWLRIKSTWKTRSIQKFGMQWGAGTPKRLNQIGNKNLRNFNKRLRGFGGGHWDWWTIEKK